MAASGVFVVVDRPPHLAPTTTVPVVTPRRPVRKYLKKGMQFYAVQGNHDAYSSGAAFFDVVDQLRRDNVTRQEGSFFALENTNWVIIGLDTARTDNNPKDVGELLLAAVAVGVCAAVLSAHRRRPLRPHAVPHRPPPDQRRGRQISRSSPACCSTRAINQVLRKGPAPAPSSG